MGSGVIPGAAPNVWENVVSARLHLLTRSVERHRASSTHDLLVGPDVTIVPAADRFNGTLMTSTVRLSTSA
jgi:hypothetical protein